jgi:hypothetical protein
LPEIPFEPYTNERDKNGHILQQLSDFEASERNEKMAHIRQMLSLKDLKLKKNLSRIKQIVESRTSISKDLNMWMHLVKGDAKFSRRMKLDSSYYNKAMENRYWKVDLNDVNLDFK